MRGLTRLLFMFGPMIVREFQKYQRRKEREQRHAAPQRQHRPNSSRDRDFSREERRRAQTPPPPPPAPPKPKISEEEKNFKMKEDEFMLDKETLNEYKEVLNPKKTVMGDDFSIEKPIQEELSDIAKESNHIDNKTSKEVVIDEVVLKSSDVEAPTAASPQDDETESDLDLKNIFFKDDDQEEKPSED